MLKKLRPTGVWSVAGWLVIVMITVMVTYTYVAAARVENYTASVERDIATGIMRGAEPRDLGPNDSPGAVLFVHGFIGTPNNFNDLPDRVADSGWRTRVMLVPGHGTTPYEFAETSADTMLAGVIDEIQALRREKYDPIIVVGHSMGGALASLAAVETPVDGLILVAPFFGLTTPSVAGVSVDSWTSIFRPVVEWVPRGPKAPVNLVANSEKILSYHWVPVDGALAAMELGRRANTRYVFDAVDVPVFLIHSNNDKVTCREAAEEAVTQFKSEDKTFSWLDRSDHVYFWDYDQQRVNEEVVQWLTRFVDGEDGDEPETALAIEATEVVEE